MSLLSSSRSRSASPRRQGSSSFESLAKSGVKTASVGFPAVSLGGHSASGPGVGSVGEYVGGFPVRSANVQSSTILELTKPSEICGGLIGGSGSKFCIRGSQDCTISTHKRSPFRGLIQGYCIKLNLNEAMTAPIIPLQKIAPDVGEKLLAHNFDSTLDVLRVFDSMVAQLQDEPSKQIKNFDSLMARISDAKASVALKTPAKVRKVGLWEEIAELTGADGLKTHKAWQNNELPVGMDLFEELSKLQTSSSEEGSDSVSPGSPRTEEFAAIIARYFGVLINSLNEERALVDILVDKVQDLQVQVGLRTNVAELFLPPTLWSAIEDASGRIDNIHDALDAQEAGQEKMDQGSMSRAPMTDGQLFGCDFADDSHDVDPDDQKVLTLGHLRRFAKTRDRKYESTYDDIAGDIYNIKGDVDALDEFVTIHDLSDEVVKLKDAISSIQKDIASFGETFKQRPLPSPVENASVKKMSVTIGRHTFTSMSDFRAYWETMFGGLEIPFGVFVDPYSFLERVQSFKDMGASTELKDMEVRKKLSLKADDGIAIKSFSHSLPRLFHNGGSAASSSSSLTSWLPGIPHKDRWEDEFGMSGVKITIRNNIEVIRSRLENIIDDRLARFPEAAALAHQALSETIAFIGVLSRYITETYDHLSLSGFCLDKSWLLVTKLVHRIFATDCHLKRGLVSEILNASDSRVLACGVLWGTFATHEVMKEYLKHGIENHPSISSEYVRFLVANSGMTKLDKAVKDMTKVQSEMKEFTKSLKTVEKTATTASNKADQALTAAKKSNK